MSIDFKRAIQEDHTLEQRMWRAQRIGWIIMIILLLCALNGLVGESPQSQIHGENSFPQSVSHNPVDGEQSPVEIHLSVNTWDEKSSSQSHYQSKGARASSE